MCDVKMSVIYNKEAPHTSYSDIGLIFYKIPLLQTQFSIHKQHWISSI